MTLEHHEERHEERHEEHQSGSDGSDGSDGSGGQQKSSAAVPLAKCPTCFGNCHLTDLQFVCSDCHGIFHVPAKAINNAKEIYYVDPDNINIGCVSNAGPLDESHYFNGYNGTTNEQMLVAIHGSVLAHLKEIHKKYKLGSLQDAATIFMLTMLDVSRMLETSKSQYVGFINEHDLKSSNLKDGGIFTVSKKSVLTQRKDVKEVNGFLQDMQKAMKLQDVVDMYKKIDPEYDSKWKFKDKENEKRKRKGK